VSARAVAPGFHPGFRVEVERIPDLLTLPPRELTPYESEAMLATLSITPRTGTGKVPKFPLVAAFIIDGDTVLADNRYVRPLTIKPPQVDGCSGTISYLASGEIGKASLHCWRRHVRWSLDCLIESGSLVIARVERGDQRGATRVYDHKAGR